MCRYALHADLGQELTSIMLVMTLNSMDQEPSVNSLLTVWNSGHTSVFVLPYKLLSSLTLATPITDWGLFWEALKSLKEAQTSRAPYSPNTPLTQESLSVSLPGNNICLSSTQRDRTHPAWPCSGHAEEGVGSRGASNANSITSLCERHKRASESEEVRVRRPELRTGARV